MPRGVAVDIPKGGKDIFHLGSIQTYRVNKHLANECLMSHKGFEG